MPVYSVKLHGPKYLEVTGEQLDPENMEDPLLIAQKHCDNERDAIGREKQKLIEQRNRLESEIDVNRENIEKLEMEASRQSCGLLCLQVLRTHS